MSRERAGKLRGTMAERTPATGPKTLMFAPFRSLVDAGFWHRLSTLKLDTVMIDESPIPITGFYAPCSYADVSSNFMLLAESFPPPDPREQSLLPHRWGRGNRNKCPVPGTLYNTNTLEGFRALDKTSLLKMEAKKILEDICSGKVEEDSALLLRVLLISFADLKKHSFHYSYAFPALMLNPSPTLISIQPASQMFTVEEAESLAAACNEWRNSSLTADVPFFLVSIISNSQATIRPLKDWKACLGDGQQLLFGFYDPCHLPSNPGWPLRNFLVFICLRWKMEKVRFFCYRERHGLADLGLSLVGEALVSVPQGWGYSHYIPEATGWELNEQRRVVTRSISLAKSMDPVRSAEFAADLNLKLMRWRALPSLNLDSLSTVKCLLLGAGALGCQVARMLMAWGVRKITLVDRARVAVSNPLRQSLYVSEDCIGDGDLKAIAAVRCLKRIFPAVEAEGIALAIPMPGHPVPSQEEGRVLEDCKHLQTLITSHDVIFLLTDTRESHWLPTLLCASENKIAITAALGFNSYLVMRHGTGPFISKPDITSVSSAKTEDIITVAAHMDSLSMADGNRRCRLGCYFCNDVIASINSTSNLMLDHQSTVTRPEPAPIASALAVELMVGMLHHPNGIHAPGEIANSLVSSSEQPLGILPHQIRGSLPQFSQLTHIHYASNSCTACSRAVVSEYRRRGMKFILQAIKQPSYLVDITGVIEPMKLVRSVKGNWDNGIDDVADAAGTRPSYEGCGDPQCVSKARGWEPNIDRLPAAATDSNLKLMMHLNSNILSTVKCLLVGAGTLGCQVARMLMAWGVRKITLLDSGKVAMSNPVRQSLYTFEDCLNGGEFKAIAAARSLKRIFPAVEAEVIRLAVPMPGHPISSQEEAGVLESCRLLQTMITSHDVIFLLTDTRESRWLPTLLCASENKIAVNAALGFDSYLVMRHGSGPIVSKLDITAASSSELEGANIVAAQIDSLSTTTGEKGRRLGCYFCNDVVAPIDSISNRTLDQQCTVTRPGLAPIASALAVDLMVRILHHPNAIHAPGEIANSTLSGSEEPLGIIPHQIRGSLSQFSQLTLVGYSSNSCTACCSTVVSEYKRRGMEFILQAINHPSYLEDLTGLTELQKSASSFDVDWEDETDDF